MRVLSAAALVILLVASPLQSQAPQPGAESSSRVARGRVLGPEGRALRAIDGPMSSILAGAAMPFAQAPSNPEGAFAIAGVAGPFRVTPLASNTRFWLKSAMVDGVNAVDDPVTITGGRSVSDVEVVMSGDAAMMEGRVTDPRVAVTPAMVLVFTTDSQRWFYGSQYVRRSRAARDGAFAIPGLPPGDSHVVAVDDLPEDESLTNLTSAELLSDLIPRARRVRVLPAARLSVELPMRSIR